MNNISLIANSGIQLFTFRVELKSDNFKKCFEDWTDEDGLTHHLELLERVEAEDDIYYFKSKDLAAKGFLASTAGPLKYEEIRAKNINPIISEDNDSFAEKVSNVTLEQGEALKTFENKWLPIPYFYKRKKFIWGPLNWSRFKLIPASAIDSQAKNKTKSYDIILAFDTRTKIEKDEYLEAPVFDNKANECVDFEVCSNELMLMDYCSADPMNKYSYIHDYIMKLFNPGAKSVDDLKGGKNKMLYIKSFFILIDFIATKKLFPRVTLYRDWDVVSKDVDMIVDIGNSRTTAILSEGKCSFETIRPLQLQDYSCPLSNTKDQKLKKYEDPFDMRLCFRKVQFGEFGISNSKQFVYPSLIRLGHEASNLIRQANNRQSVSSEETLSTYSSPKRYLWDKKLNSHEWKFLLLNDNETHIIELPGITNQLKPDGTIDETGNGGSLHRYSRRSLMTFAFLEMLTQANIQINSEEYRNFRGDFTTPRKIKRIIVTCPTTMSRSEREALIQSAKDATILLGNFEKNTAPITDNDFKIEIVPTYNRSEDNSVWYYDEATCSQLVYMYSEVAHKYKGNCTEFFHLYGKTNPNTNQTALTVGSLDIGAGTTDLMICRYDYSQENTTMLKPDPLFYDSFYFAGDDLLHDMVQSLMLACKDTSLREACAGISDHEYTQRIKNFFGPDHAGQSFDEKLARRDFNLQISVPLMSYFLDLLGNGSPDCMVKFQDVFSHNVPNERVLDHFMTHFGIDFKNIIWKFNRQKVSDIISNFFDPLLQKIAAIMYAYSCDVIILSGRPSSLPPIRQLFLKYYAVSPDRLISLNNYYVGDWYPGDNTGYIKNPKTIVAVGAIIGFYASTSSSFEDFSVDTSLLQSKLKSTINYVDMPNSKNGYCLTEDSNHGEVVLNRIPAVLNIRQIDIQTYPSRPLFCIDYNYAKIEQRIRKNNPEVSDGRIRQLMKDEIDKLGHKFPVKITLSRIPDDKESIVVESEDSLSNNLQVNIQSLGASGQYWLDTGIFEF